MARLCNVKTQKREKRSRINREIVIHDIGIENDKN